jgi:hypothetical protein
MNYHQVALAVLAFSSARGGTLDISPAEQFSVVAPSGGSKVIVERDNQQPGSWYVRLVKHSPAGIRRSLYAFPAVTTQEGLQEALAKAWEFHRQTTPPAPFLARFLEPPTSAPTRLTRALEPLIADQPSSPPRSASPPRRRRDA